MAFSLSDFSERTLLGQGGMGKVYTATQTSLNRKVAIKEMVANLMGDTTLVKRFEMEAKSAASLDHDNIIRIYDFGEDKGCFYIAMEFIDGPDLDHLINKKDFPREIGFMIMLQALKGLHYAHQRNIIHRDIKPGNILISKTGRAKVLDFGLAHAGSQQSMHLTKADSLIGTPMYMSPEQAKGEEIKDQRMDVFSAGVLLYRIASGKFPFGGTNIPSILYNVIHTKEQHISELVPTLPDELSDVISKCLEKEKEKRLPDLGPVIHALQNYFYTIGVRDTVEEISGYINKQQTGIIDFLKNLIHYHVKKGEEFSTSGEFHKSRAHFKEALKYDPENKEITKVISGMENLESTMAYTPSPKEKPEKTSGIKKIIVDEKKKGRKKVLAMMLFVAALSAAGILGFIFLKGDPTPEKTAPLQKRAPVAQRQTALHQQGEEKPAIPAPVPQTEKAQHQQSTRPAAAVKMRVPEKQLPAVPPREQFGILEVTVEPLSAQVLLNGKGLSRQEMKGIRLKEGAYTISASAPDYESYEKSVVIKENTNRTVDIALKTAVKKDGSVHIYSYPWAEVYIDGQHKGRSPTPKPITLSEGRHALVLQREGFKSYEEFVTIQEGNITRIKVTLTQVR